MPMLTMDLSCSMLAPNQPVSTNSATSGSLLYKKNSQGDFVLIGAMYTASKRTSEADLNERVPLSGARWQRRTAL